jgi:hypothetical protein
MHGEIVTLGAARSTQYALLDNFRGLPDMPVYRVNASGQIETLGQLTPVRPDKLSRWLALVVNRHASPRFSWARLCASTCNQLGLAF